MSYSNLNDVWSDVNDVITAAQNVKSALNPALEIVRDPYFPVIVSKIAKLHDLEQTPGGPSVPGVGLKHLVFPLGVYVEYRTNPYLIGPLLVGAAIGLPFLLGYMYGKGKR